MSLFAFDPKVIKGGWQPKEPADALPNTSEELREWERGFVDAVDGTVYAESDPRDVTHVSQFTKPYREGYAAGRRARDNARVSTLILALIREKMRGVAADERIQRGQERAARGHGVQMPERRYGGERLPWKKVCDLFAETGSPAHTTKTPGGRGYYSLWINETGTAIYSYDQKIAEKARASRSGHYPPGVCYVDPRTFSKTTSKFQRYLGVALKRAGWEMKYRNLDHPGS